MAHTKDCSDCGKSFEATLEFFHKQKDGLLDRCKTCQNKRTAEYRIGKGKHYWINHHNPSEGYFFKNRKQWNEYLNNWMKEHYRAIHNCTIYKITNTITEEVYVGLTQTPVNLRYSQHKNCLNGKISGAPLLLKSFRDHGLLHHKIEVIEELDTTDRKVGDERETYWIQHYVLLGKSLNKAKTK